MNRLNLGAAALLMFAWLFAPSAAYAAESYDNCTGFITSLPAVITTQGTWCLKQDLTTAITSGNAITINTNNVTIDCNDFKLGGLAAGVGTQAQGVVALNRVNATVRHCSIRGFFSGIFFSGVTGGGHAVEDNRFDGNTFTGAWIEGDGSVVRRNRVFNTGGSTITTYAIGIEAVYSADVLDNAVFGVTATAGSNNYAYGITTFENHDGRVIGNGVRGLVKDGTGKTLGIYNENSDRVVMRNNDVVGDLSSGSIGLRCSNSNGHARDNEISNFNLGITGCTSVSGNDIY